MAAHIVARARAAFLVLLSLAALAGCGGGGDNEPAPAPACALPADQSAFSMACAVKIDPPAGTKVTVTVDGEVVATNTAGAAGTFSRYVQISFAGGGYEGQYITQRLSPGQSAVVRFTLKHTFIPEQETNDRPIDVGFSSLEPVHDIDTTVRNVTLTVD